MEWTRSPLSNCLCNDNRNLQHAVADRQTNFQACSFNLSDSSHTRTVLHSRDVARTAGEWFSAIHLSAGRMFWFPRKKLFGSYFCLSAASRW